ncbi:MAG: glycine cleavage system H protein [Anaerolineaceae bacterium]|nr:MAG: glycine cleavage system H protein [Anaerolineaceae bacterium]
MNIPANFKFSKSDEWFDPATGKIGVTDFAQSQLSDIVFVEIVVGAGDAVEPGKAIASVESVKAAAEIYAPVKGKVVAVNDGLGGAPEVLNSDPYGAGWMIQVEGADASGMMDAAAYAKYCEERAH